MKNLILVFSLLLSTFVNSQTFEFNFFTKFEHSGTVVDTNILNSPGFEYTHIGFGKNKITINKTTKTVVNEYYVNETNFGTLLYTNMSNYKKSNGVTKFQAQRLNPETNEMYTEYFIINESASTNSPYFISYWYVNGTINGSIVPKSAIMFN